MLSCMAPFAWSGPFRSPPPHMTAPCPSTSGATRRHSGQSSSCQAPLPGAYVSYLGEAGAVCELGAKQLCVYPRMCICALNHNQLAGALRIRSTLAFPDASSCIATGLVGHVRVGRYCRKVDLGTDDM